MPARIADVEIAVAAGVVEIVAQNAGGNVVDARVVEQAAQVFALVGEGHNARARPAFVLFAVVPAAVRGPYGLKFLDNAVDAIGHEAGEVQVAEGVEEVDLLLRQARFGHVISSRLLLTDSAPNRPPARPQSAPWFLRGGRGCTRLDRCLLAASR